MAKVIKKRSNSNGIIKTVGTENYLVKNTPCLIPKENIGIFGTMQKNAGISSFGNYPNPFDSWKK